MKSKIILLVSISSIPSQDVNLWGNVFTYQKSENFFTFMNTYPMHNFSSFQIFLTNDHFRGNKEWFQLHVCHWTRRVWKGLESWVEENSPDLCDERDAQSTCDSQEKCPLSLEREKVSELAFPSVSAPILILISVGFWWTWTMPLRTEKISILW